MDDVNIRWFLKNIVQTVSAIILWAVMQIFFGLYLKLGLVDERLTAKNIIFFICSLGTLVLLFFYVRKQWRTK